MAETGNGYFAIFDGHAGTFAADWCGQKLHLILEDVIRKNPNLLVGELLDQTLYDRRCAVGRAASKGQRLPGDCCAVFHWADRVPSYRSATGSQAIPTASAKAAEKASIINDKPGRAITKETRWRTAKVLAHAWINRLTRPKTVAEETLQRTAIYSQTRQALFTRLRIRPSALAKHLPSFSSLPFQATVGWSVHRHDQSHKRCCLDAANFSLA